MLSFKLACENLYQEDLSFLSAFYHWMVSSVYLKLLLFLLAILIILVFHPAQHLYTMYSAYKFYLCLDCCKQCCNEHWGVCILLNHGFNPDICPEAEKEVASHSNILVWKIPWTEEPGGLKFMGLQRVGHSLCDRLHT